MLCHVMLAQSVCIKQSRQLSALFKEDFPTRDWNLTPVKQLKSAVVILTGIITYMMLCT